MSAPVPSESFDAETLANLRYKFTAEINNLSPWAALHCFTVFYAEEWSDTLLLLHAHLPACLHL